jgi:prepilin-type N-terminal cleavage/methylation domain-containing protein
MSLKNIKSNTQAQRGFTIVELLIVVVVIAILAAITIVSYNGITNRANASAAQSTATVFQKKAELFASDGPTGTYPRALTDLTGGASGTTNILSNPAINPAITTSTSSSWYVAHGSVKITAIVPNRSNGKDTIQYQVCGNLGSSTAPTTIASMTNVVGGIIAYYDYANSTTILVNMGTTTTGGTPNNACIAAAA